MNSVLTAEQSAILANIVYTKDIKTDQYIFDNQEISKSTNTLKDYIYNDQGNFHEGIPQDLRDQIALAANKFNQVLDNFTLMATSNTIENHTAIGGAGYYAIAVTPKLNTTEMVIVNKGTSELGDYASDAEMLAYRISQNMMAGVNFIDMVDKIYTPEIFSGANHSAGATIAQAQAQATYIGSEKLGMIYNFEGYGGQEILQGKKEGGTYYEVGVVEDRLTGEKSLGYVAVTDPIKITLYENYAVNHEMVNNKIINYAREGDLIAFWATNIGDTIIIPGHESLGLLDAHTINNYLYQKFDQNGALIPNELDISIVNRLYEDGVAEISRVRADIEQIKDEALQNLHLFHGILISDNPILLREYYRLGHAQQKLMDQLSNYNNLFLGMANYNQTLFSSEYQKENVMKAFKGDILMCLMGEGSAVNDFIDSLVNDDFTEASKIAFPPRDPLILDLDGDGIETIAAHGNILFDHDSDGVKHATGWVNGDDALLVRDLDNNGQIDSGLELFGDNTIKQNGEKATDGFDALLDLDDNNDGVFNVEDHAFSEVGLWQDKNEDGVVQEGEITALANSDVQSIDLNVVVDNGSNADGGVIVKSSTYRDLNGQKHDIGALNFNVNSFYREYSDDFYYQFADKLEEQNLAFSLRGSGAVRDLNQAAVLNPVIVEIVQAITETENYNTRKMLYQKLVKAWADSAESFNSVVTELEGLELSSGTTISFDLSDTTRQRLERIAVLETFNFSNLVSYDILEKGENSELRVSIGNWWNLVKFTSGKPLVLKDDLFSGLPRQNSLLDSAYNKLLSSVENTIFRNYDYQRFVDMIEINSNDEGELSLGFDAIDQYFIDRVDATAVEAVGLLLLIKLAPEDLLGKLGWDANKTLAKTLRSMNEEALAELAQIDSYVFKNGVISNAMLLTDDIAYTVQGNSIVVGNNQDNVVTPIDSKRYIGTSNSLSSFNYIDAGAGDDWIYSENGNWYNDTIFGGEGDDYLASNALVFEDQRAYYAKEFFTSDALYGEAGNDELQGGGSNDILDGGEGDDVIVARAGNNHIFGGNGNDLIISGAMLSEVYSGVLDGGVVGERYLNEHHNVTIAGKGDDIIEINQPISIVWVMGMILS